MYPTFDVPARFGRFWREPALNLPEVFIERLGRQGDGIAKGPIYVPLALPGEIVTVEIDGDRMASPNIVSPSPMRVSAPCPHFRRCGGCAVQHASDELVANWKTDIVKETMEAQGLPAPIRSAHVSPPHSRRRATLAGRRTKSGALVGFHARGSNEVIGIRECAVATPEIVSLLPELEKVTAQIASRKGAVKFMVTSTETGVDLAISGAKDLDEAAEAALAALPGARVTNDGELIAQHAAPAVQFDGIVALPLPGAFLQATEPGQQALIASVREVLSGCRQILDLFAGCGTFALPLARLAEVHAVEGESDQIDVLRHAWRHAPLKKLTTEVRDLFRHPLVLQELARFDGVAIDPPRAGAEAQAAELTKSDVARIAMVSCNPVTFARDASTLIAAGFSLNWIDVVDQFRWSLHIELVGSFTR